MKRVSSGGRRGILVVTTPGSRLAPPSKRYINCIDSNHTMNVFIAVIFALSSLIVSLSDETSDGGKTGSEIEKEMIS